MEELKFTVRMLTAKMHQSLKEFADGAGINYNHLRLVSCGDATMSGEDLMKLSTYTGIPPKNIETSKEAQKG